MGLKQMGKAINLTPESVNLQKRKSGTSERCDREAGDQRRLWRTPASGHHRGAYTACVCTQQDSTSAFFCNDDMNTKQ